MLGEDLLGMSDEGIGADVDLLDEATLEDRVGSPLRQSAQPALPVFADKCLDSAKQLPSSLPITNAAVQLELYPNHLGPARIPGILEEVGVDQPGRIVGRVFPDGCNEG